MFITSTLLFFFLAALALVCILVLQAMASRRSLKVGYVGLALTFVIWVWQLYGLPSGLGSWWVYALPILWLVLLFRYGFPVTARREYPGIGTAEPRFTQESLAGPSARREALTFYFLLLLIVLILGLVFFDMTLLYR